MVASYVDGNYIAPSLHDPSVPSHAQSKVAKMKNSRHHWRKMDKASTETVRYVRFQQELSHVQLIVIQLILIPTHTHFPLHRFTFVFTFV